MTKIVFDADGLIKLIHSGIFRNISHECFISEQVYHETVAEGKKKLYADAFQIEQFINEGKIKIKKVDMITEAHGLGKGEVSTLDLFRQIKADVIISDDRKFLSALEEQDIPFIIPTEYLVALVKSKQIEPKEGINALEKIRVFVTNESYISALEALGGKK